MSFPNDATLPRTSPAALPWRWAGFLAALVLAGDVALLHVPHVGSAPSMVTWWTTVGLGTGLVALTRVRRWPATVLGLAVVGTAARLLVGIDLEAASSVAALHAAQALAAGVVLTAGGRRPAALDTVRDLARLAGAALAGGLLAVATRGVVTGERELDGVGTLSVFTSHTVAILVLTALVLSATKLRSRASTDELILQLLLTGAVTAVAFGPADHLPLVFAPIPFLAWAAMRFDVGIVAGELVGFSVATTLLTSQGHGPFSAVSLSTSSSGAITQAYVIAATLVTLPVALLVGQRQRLLELVQEDERGFRSSFTDSPLGMLFLHDDGHRLVVDDGNDAAGRILSVGTGDLAGRSLADLIETFEPLTHVVGSLRRGEIGSWHGGARAVARDASRIDVALNGIGTRRGVSIISAQLLDVTQEHDARRRLEAATRLTDTTLDTTACIIMVTDTDGTIVRVNGATKEITGYDKSELVGLALWHCPLSPFDRAATEAMFLWPNRSGFPVVQESAARAKDGTARQLVWNSNIVRDELGMPSYAVLTGIDVTAERTSTGLMMHLMRASTFTALIGLDETGVVTMVNAGTEHMLGYTTHELVGRPFAGLLDPVQLRDRTGAGADPFAGLVATTVGQASADWTWSTRTGPGRVVSMTLTTTDTLAGPTGYLCVGRDVTEQRESQHTVLAALTREQEATEQLRVLDRAKDDFVSTVSHELRTPVTSILGYAELLREEMAHRTGDVHHLAMLDTIARNAQRLNAICNDLLVLGGFDHLPDVKRDELDLCQVVALAEDATRALVLHRDLTLTFDQPTTPVRVRGDRAQLDRVLLNLISNAIKFTDDGGRVDVVLRDDGPYAVITVADDGQGIDAADQELVFQRFYRTREAQRLAIPGTGLGLAIVQGIVEAHDGRIDLDSAAGAGATFTVRLPLA